MGGGKKCGYKIISPANPILCGIGIMLVIKCCNMFKLSSLVVSSVTFLYFQIISYSLHKSIR